MKKVLLSALILFWFSAPVVAQGWQHKFGSAGFDIANTVIQTADGGYITAGGTNGYGDPGRNIYVIKTDANGKMEWQQVIGSTGDQEAFGIVENSSGEFYVAGQTTGGGAGGIDLYLVKLGSSGNVIWTGNHGGALDDYARGIVITAANDIVIAGTTKSLGAGGSDVYLIKINPAGGVVWSKTFGKTGNELGNGISIVHDGGFLISGYTNSFSTNYGYVVRTDSDGDSLWTRSFNVGTNNSATLQNGVELISNTQFAFVGSGGNLGYGHMVTVVTDLNGTPTNTTVSSLLADGGNGITATSDGGFATASVYCNFGCKAVLTKFDAAGTKLWNNYFITGTGFSFYTFSNGISLQETADGGFIIAGQTLLPGVQSDVVLIKTDEDGIIPEDYITTPVASGPTSFCTGGSVQLSVPEGFDQYQWLWFSTGNSLTWLANTDTNAITVTAFGSYQCVMTNKDGIYFSYLLPVNVISVPSATITASGPLLFCGPVQNLTLTAPSDNNSTYEWKLNGGIISGATASTYQPTTPGSYTVTMTNNCGTSTSSPAVVNNNLQPTANINSTWASIEIVNFQYCYIPTLNVANQPGVTYQWFLNGSPTGSGTYNIYASQPGYYYVTATNSCGTATSDSATVMEYYSTLAVTSLSNTSGCGTFPVTLESAYSYGNYQWYNNGLPISGAVNQTYDAISNGYYTCEILHYCNGGYWPTTCEGLSVNLTGTAIPSISATGATTVCSGNVLLNASQAGATYQWYKDFVQIPGATLQSYTASVTGLYRCQIISATCGYVTSNTIFVKIGLPTGTISGNTSSCDGHNVSLSISTTDVSTSFTSIQWRFNGSPISGANGMSYQANQGGTYDCEITNACGSTITNSHVLNVTTLNVNITSSGGNILCPGQPLTLSTPLVAGYSYQWRLNSSFISGATSNTLLVTQNGNYQVRVIALGCTKYSTTISVVNAILPSINIWSSTLPEFCTTGSVVLNANTRADFFYSWTRNGTTIPGATAATYSATVGGAYKVIITDSTGCSDSSPDLEINSNSIGNFTITASGPPTFCTGGSVQLTSSATGTSYQWYRNFNAIPGATGNNYLADSSGLYGITVTNALGCTGSATLSVNEINPIGITPTLTHPSCASSNGAISVVLSDYTFPITYLWSTGSSSASLSGLAAGTYTLTVTDANGCSTQATMVLIGGPIAQLTASTPTAVCAGTTVTLNATTGTGYTYVWKKYGNIIPGATGSSYSPTSSGKYKVIVTDAGGCSASSNAIIVSIYPLPAASAIASGPTTFCPGNSVQLIANSGAGLTYQWKKNNNPIPGATASTYAAATTGRFKVTVTNANGCSRTSNVITVTILAAPPASITASGPTTFCAGGSVTLTANAGAGLTYQWRNGPANIPGATGISYVATTAGNFRCMVTNSIGCTKSSNFILVSVPCRMGLDEESNTDVTVYPNPTPGYFIIEFKTVPGATAEIQIYDIIGRTVDFRLDLQTESRFGISGLQPGVYVINSFYNNQKFTTRVVVTK